MLSKVGSLDFGVMSGDLTKDTFQAVWTKSGNQDKDWRKGEATVRSPGGQQFYVSDWHRVHLKTCKEAPHIQSLHCVFLDWRITQCFAKNRWEKKSFFIYWLINLKRKK